MIKENHYQLKVIFNGVSYIGLASVDKSILENIEAMNIPIKSACRRGLCGSCSVQLICGQLDPTKKIVINNQVRTCSSFLKSDAEVLIEYSKE